MDLPPQIADAVEAHRAELEAELATARSELARARALELDHERDVLVLETLLLSSQTDQHHREAIASELTLHDAMVVVLNDAPSKRMRAGELAAEINRRRLYRMRDGRPVETQQIHARVGHYPQLLAKAGTMITVAPPTDVPLGTGVANDLAPPAGGVDPRDAPWLKANEPS